MVARPGAALVVFAVLLALLVAGCSAGTQSVAPVNPAPAPASPAPDEPDEPKVALPVYYVAETAGGLWLQREFHRVATNDPGSDAVREMLATPTGIDPDYRTLWPEGTTLRAPVSMDGGEIVVDLTGVGPAQEDPRSGELAVQQLVFTVQGALQSTDPVRILVDGRAIDEGDPVERGDPYALRSLVQIDTPVDGAVVGPKVEVTGEAAVFEATVLWEVLRDGAVVQSGFTSTTEGQRFAPYTFVVTLEPGTYTVRVLESDSSDGEGRSVMSDDKTITIRR
jgi:immunoglobulin-like protein involved in spore germination/sporulation and spore germination protein